LEGDVLKKVEEVFLKIARLAILIAMTIGLVGTLGLALFAYVEYSKSPIEPTPAIKAPEKEISFDEFLNNLEPKKEETKQQMSKSQGDVSKPPAPALLYIEAIAKLYRCSQDFAKAVGAELEDSKGDANRIEDLRSKMEAIAKKPNHGSQYVTSAVAFTCAALANPRLIKMKSDGLVKTVFFPTLNFHLGKWEEMQAEMQNFSIREAQRIESERVSERARIAVSKARAITLISAAGIAFISFMFLAMYLLGAKIESNLRDINASLKKS